MKVFVVQETGIPGGNGMYVLRDENDTFLGFAFCPDYETGFKKLYTAEEQERLKEMYGTVECGDEEEFWKVVSV